MRGARLLVLMLAAGAAAAAIAWPADAQCRLCQTPTTSLEPSISTDDVRLEIDTNLDFDRLIVGGQGGGDATLRPDGSNLATGSIDMGPRGRVATVIVHGQPGRALRIDVPRRIDLYSLEGSRLTFDEVTTDANELPRLDSAGNLTFHIGGRLRFLGDEDGDYRGDLPITVEYL
jgi:Domain of unknown function (DUF4402)